MRIKYDYRTASKDTYNRFKLQFPESQLTYKQFSDIVYGYTNEFRLYILESGDICKLPYGLGYFTVVKKKIKRYKNYLDPEGKPYINLSVDWKSTKKEGKKIYHMNFHTDGFKCRWFWHIGSSRFYQSSNTVFKACRKTSRLLAEYLNKPNSEYLQMYHELINNRF